MEGLGGFSFSSVGTVVKKPRSARRRRQVSPPSSTPSSDDAGNRRKEFCLNDPSPRISSVSKTEGLPASKKVKKDNKMINVFDRVHENGSQRNNEQGRRGTDLKHSMPANSRNTSRIKESFGLQSGYRDGGVGRNGDGDDVHKLGRDFNRSAEHRLTKVKLKVGGVTRTIHAKSNEETGNNDNGGSSAKAARPLESTRHRQKPNDQDNSSYPPEEGDRSQGDQRKDSTRVGFSREAKEDSLSKSMKESLSGKQTDIAYTTLRKSNRVPKRRLLDGAFDQGDEVDAVHYIERLRASKASRNTMEHGNDGEDAKKRKFSKDSQSKSTAYEVDENRSFFQQSRDSRKKLKPGKECNDTDYVEEEEPGSDADPESKRKKQKNVSIESPTDVRTEPLITRQRALQSGKGGTGASLIEFPDGLPPPPSRKPKEKLSEVEQQAKKAEAAQRRKLQLEKQAKELQEEAIRKILGHDSDRKKEEKKQKELEEKAKAAKSRELAPNTIKWIRGAVSTVVVFPEGYLPNIFQPKRSYPPPREKCAGPSCTNPYKYRHSKLNLPLCGLQCYRAVEQQHVDILHTCSDLSAGETQ